MNWNKGSEATTQEALGDEKSGAGRELADVGTIPRRWKQARICNIIRRDPQGGPWMWESEVASRINSGGKDMRHSNGPAPGTSGGPTREEPEKEVPQAGKVEAKGRDFVAATCCTMFAALSWNGVCELPSA